MLSNIYTLKEPKTFTYRSSYLYNIFFLGPRLRWISFVLCMMQWFAIVENDAGVRCIKLLLCRAEGACAPSPPSHQTLTARTPFC